MRCIPAHAAGCPRSDGHPASPGEEETWIRDLIRAHQPVIHGFHKLRTRKSGNFRFIEFHIKVDPEMTVGVSHRITEELSNSIERPLSGSQRHRSTPNPVTAGVTRAAVFGCLLSEVKRERYPADEAVSRLDTSVMHFRRRPGRKTIPAAVRSTIHTDQKFALDERTRSKPRRLYSRRPSSDGKPPAFRMGSIGEKSAPPQENASPEAEPSFPVVLPGTYCTPCRYTGRTGR